MVKKIRLWSETQGKRFAAGDVQARCIHSFRLSIVWHEMKQMCSPTNLIPKVKHPIVSQN